MKVTGSSEYLVPVYKSTGVVSQKTVLLQLPEYRTLQPKHSLDGGHNEIPLPTILIITVALNSSIT